MKIINIDYNIKIIELNEKASWTMFAGPGS